MSDTAQQWKPHANPWLITIVVTLGAFMEVLDTTIVNVSLPYIAGSLSVSNDESTWTLTSYLVANGIVLTISGALSRRLGRKRYFLICLIGFTACSFVCGVSENFGEILLARAAQGFFGGGLQPTQNAIILDTFPPEKRQQAFSLTAIAIIVAPVLGPVVGGYLTFNYSWHWIFLINIPVGILTIFGVLHSSRIRHISTNRSAPRRRLTTSASCSSPWRSAAWRSAPTVVRITTGSGRLSSG